MKEEFYRHHNYKLQTAILHEWHKTHIYLFIYVRTYLFIFVIISTTYWFLLNVELGNNLVSVSWWYFDLANNITSNREYFLPRLYCLSIS